MYGYMFGLSVAKTLTLTVLVTGRFAYKSIRLYRGRFAYKTFILSVKLEDIRIGTSLNILVTQNSKTSANRCFRARNLLPRNNAVYRAEDRPTAICLKMTFT